MRFFLLLLVASSSMAQTPPAEDLSVPQTWLGRGLVGRENFRRSVNYWNQAMKEHAKETGKEVLPKSHWEKWLSPTDIPRYLGLACVGRDSAGRSNCYKIQPTEVDLAHGKVIARGKVMLIQSDLQSEALQAGIQAAPEPSRKSIREFVRDLKMSYIAFLQVKRYRDPMPAFGRMFSFGIRSGKALIDQDGWDWASQAVHLRSNVYETYRNFLLSHEAGVYLSGDELHQAWSKSRSGPGWESHEQIIARAQAAKRKLLTETPFPNSKK